MIPKLWDQVSSSTLCFWCFDVDCHSVKNDLFSFFLLNLLHNNWGQWHWLVRIEFTGRYSILSAMTTVSEYRLGYQYNRWQHRWHCWFHTNLLIQASMKNINMKKVQQQNEQHCICRYMNDGNMQWSTKKIGDFNWNKLIQKTSDLTIWISTWFMKIPLPIPGTQLSEDRWISIFQHKQLCSKLFISILSIQITITQYTLFK